MGEPALTDGVVNLRAWAETDADWYAATSVGDELIQRFTTESPTTTAQQVRDAIVGLHGRTDMVRLVICDAVSGDRLGNIGLHDEDGASEVFYWLAADARGRGAATRAVRLLSDWAQASRPPAALRLLIRDDNAASRRVAERAGYQRDPGRDVERQVKGATWRLVAYVRHAPTRSD